MPLDGATYWQPTGWTIRVGLDRARMAQSRHWSERKRRVFRKLAIDAVYAAIDAIQSGHLYKQRRQIWREGSWIKYFLRRDPREKRTVLVTIELFHFFDPRHPEGPRGGGSPLPVDLLTVHVSGSGLRYKIERIEGISPLPRPPARNRIVSLLEQLSRRKDKPGYLDIVGKPTPDGRTARISISVGGVNSGVYYSPGVNGSGRVLLEMDQLYRRGSIGTLPRSGLLAQLRQAFSGLGGRGKSKPANGAVSMLGGSGDGVEGFTYSVALRNASAWPSTVAQTRLQPPNRPIRP
jgi:hypothetical protein